MMTYRRLGRTGLRVSVVGFGTNQLRSVPHRQALATLRTGFDLGVNIVHTAPDYEGAEDLVAAAIAASGRPVYVCSNGYGSIDHFEHLFETTRAKFNKKQLELFGIASVEDREILGENVWGAGGMVEFLAAKKRQGRLMHTFCTTHGPPDFIRRLIECGAFDAVMLAYNPLGFHLLSFHPRPPRRAEDVAGNVELFSLAASHDVGLMVMEVLAGGLLCNGRAFPPHRDFREGASKDAPPLPTAREVLCHLLRMHPEISCVVPGTASVEEAEENARAGHAALDDAGETEAIQAQGRLGFAVTHLQSSVCSRCGKCEELCSQNLPVSWLFRAAYIHNSRSVPFEIPLDGQYFDLHPTTAQAVCASCPDVTCKCPAGINIPAELVRMHELMVKLHAEGEVPGPTPARTEQIYGARLLGRWFNGGVARVSVQNTGTHGWHLAAGYPAVFLQVRTGKETTMQLRLRADVPSGERGHFAFEWPSGGDVIPQDLWLVIRGGPQGIYQEIFLGQLMPAAAENSCWDDDEK